MQKAYGFHSYAMGFEGDHAMELLPDGFVWSVQAGPNARLRYTLRVIDGQWQEFGERLVEGHVEHEDVHLPIADLWRGEDFAI